MRLVDRMSRHSCNSSGNLREICVTGYIYIYTSHVMFSQAKCIESICGITHCLGFDVLASADSIRHAHPPFRVWHGLTPGVYKSFLYTPPGCMGAWQRMPTCKVVINATLAAVCYGSDVYSDTIWIQSLIILL